MSDPYLYPGTNTLINRFNVTDPKQLQAIESQYYYIRSIKPLPKGSFDYDHLKALHKHFFDDVYPWAGQQRTVDISKQGNLFAHNAFIESSLTKLFKQLHQEKRLEGLEADTFYGRLSYYFNEVNAVHPFREGNGRTQRVFFEELAKGAGYQLDWKKIDREAYIEASIAGYDGDYAPMTNVFKKIGKPLLLKLDTNGHTDFVPGVAANQSEQDHLQKKQRQTLHALKKIYPDLNEYDKLYVERSRATGFKASQLDKALLIKAKAITGNKSLYAELQRDLPKLAASLSKRVLEYGLDRGRDL